MIGAIIGLIIFGIFLIFTTLSYQKAIHAKLINIEDTLARWDLENE